MKGVHSQDDMSHAVALFLHHGYEHNTRFLSLAKHQLNDGLYKYDIRTYVRIHRTKLKFSRNHLSSDYDILFVERHRSGRNRLITFYRIVFFVVIRQCVLQIDISIFLPHFFLFFFIYKTLDVTHNYVKVLARIDSNTFRGG